MKTTQKTVTCLACFLMVNVSIAQTPPFGLPPSEVNQPPTPDEQLSGIGNITLEPEPDEGGGIGGGSCPEDIEHTGADMQLTGLDQTVAKVVVWDGCPGFFFSISSDAYSPPHLSVSGKIEGSKHGTVSDPDVVLTQNNSNGDISILIVYQLYYFTNNRIAFEQWDYVASTNTLSLNYPASVPPAEPYLLTGGGSTLDQLTPNITGNNDDNISIVYIIKDLSTNATTMATMLSDFSKSPPTEFNTEIKFDNCPGTNLISPDVSISDRNALGVTPIMSYVAIKDNDPTSHGGLFLIQQEYDILNAVFNP